MINPNPNKLQYEQLFQEEMQKREFANASHLVAGTLSDIEEAIIYNTRELDDMLLNITLSMIQTKLKCLQVFIDRQAALIRKVN